MYLFPSKFDEHYPDEDQETNVDNDPDGSAAESDDRAPRGCALGLAFRIAGYFGRDDMLISDPPSDASLTRPPLYHSPNRQTRQISLVARIPV